MQGSLRYEFYDSHFETILLYLAVLNLLLKFIPQQSPHEYIKTFHACCYLVLNGGGAMHAQYRCVCQLQCQIRCC